MPLTSPIYVERVIRAPFDALWSATQRPEIHERWDLRSTEIRYLPRPTDNEPQRFLYATRIGFGLRIVGAGETVGGRDRDGDRTSALRFWSDDPKSLIREGSGYWRYTPVDGAIRFITLYDYETRFGLIGRLADLVFRPLLGWATAWSFDRLRLWLERGIDPATSLQRTAIHWVARLTLSFIWLYHGVVPKLLTGAQEAALVERTGVPEGLAPLFVVAAGLFEAGFGIGLLLTRDARPFLWVSALLAIGFAVVTTIRAPDLLSAPFQPVTLGIAMAALTATALIADRDLPRAANCLRRSSRA